MRHELADYEWAAIKTDAAQQATWGASGERPSRHTPNRLEKMGTTRGIRRLPKTVLPPLFSVI